MVVHGENPAEPTHDLTAAHPQQLRGLLEGEARISSIAVEVADLHAELVRLRGESEAVERSLDDRQAELAEKEASLARLADECARAQEGRAEAQASLIEAEQRLEDSRARVVTLEDELALLRSQIAELDRLELSPDIESEPAPAFHFRLVLQPSGYTLSESAEPPPDVGESLELDGRRFTVVRIGRSPLPLDMRPCVFLVPEHDHVSAADRT